MKKSEIIEAIIVISSTVFLASLLFLGIYNFVW
jgi:hypothetical protein